MIVQQSPARLPGAHPHRMPTRVELSRVFSRATRDNSTRVADRAGLSNVSAAVRWGAQPSSQGARTLAGVRSAVVAAPMRDIATSTSSASSSITRRTPSWPPAMSP